MATPWFAYYCVAKCALDMYTKTLALEMAPKGVRVTGVNPGFVMTEFQKRLFGDKGQELATNMCKEHPMGRPGQVDDIANMIIFLASPKAAFIVGQTYRVDG
eukprot:119679_1